MTGTGDADLYVKFGAQPTAQRLRLPPVRRRRGRDLRPRPSRPARPRPSSSVNGYAATRPSTLNVIVGGAIPDDLRVQPERGEALHDARSTSTTSASRRPSTDGNLGATIDRYTHTDTTTTSSRLDAAGKIIGGEWVGASKRSTPTSCGCPSGVGATVGRRRQDHLREREDALRPRRCRPARRRRRTGTDKTVNETGTVAKGAWKQYGPFNVAAGTTLTATMTGDGDADLYVRKGAAPTAERYDCRPYTNGSTETLLDRRPGDRSTSASTATRRRRNYAARRSSTPRAGRHRPPTPPPADVHAPQPDRLGRARAR